MRSRSKGVVVALSVFLTLAFAPAAQASKTVHSFWGNTAFPPQFDALDGGILAFPRGLAVNVSGTGGASAGDVYIAADDGNRIDQFSASGTFVRAFGRDVVESGKANDNGEGFEICDTTAGNVAADCREGASFPAEGGTLSSPQGVAINQSTGDVYVTNGELRRVEVFDATGHFLRAFGQDVVASGPNDSPATSAQQTLTVAATEGQFKLTFRGQTTADIAFDATAEQVDSALEALSTVAAGNVAVTGGPGGAGGGAPYVVSFEGALANAPMPPIAASTGTTPLGGGSGASVANTTTGATGFEICVAGADTCQEGQGASSAGAFNFGFVGYLEVAPVGAPNAGNVLVTDPGNNRVSEYTAAGAFVRSFGWDVSASPPDVTSGFESCDASNLDVCKAGTSGDGVGQFAESTVSRVAIDSTGAVYTVEPSTNMRVQKFTPSGGTLVPSLFAPGVLSGTSSEDAPTEVEVGASDRVFVVKGVPAGTGTPAADAQEERVLELNASGTLLDTHLANAGLRFLQGLAANPSTGRLYLTSFEAAGRVYVLADAAAPTATVAPVTGVSATTATFHGEVNPGGVIGEHRFEYVDDATYQATGFADATQLPFTDSGNANTATPVSHLAVDLDPSTLYHVRLVAKHRFGATSASSGETTFTTAASKPTVAPFGVADASEIDAALYVRVTPHSQPTTYFFQWGPTAAYGNTTPVQSAGSGADSVLASAQISGLSPNTTYHFRLVATNASGATEGPDQTFATDAPEPGACANAEFRTGFGANLPECRAYEQVSPPDKNGGDVGGEGTAGAAVADDGNRALFETMTEFANPTHGGSTSESEYLASRGPANWQTSSIIPRPEPVATGGNMLFHSADLGLSVIESSAVLESTPPDTSDDYTNVYLRDSQTGVVSPFLGLSDGSTGPFGGVVATPDLNKIVFFSGAVLTSDPGVDPDRKKVYEVTISGQVRLVSVKPDGTPFQTDATTGGSGGFFSQLYSVVGAISDDGRHVFFEAEEGLYRRSDGTTTELASASRRATPDPENLDKEFVFGSRDGNRVVFMSSERLTDDANSGPLGPFPAGKDLYRYDFEADRLIDISATPGGNGAEVEGVLGFDEDADRIYYVARGQVVPGQGTPGQANLYLWEDDGTANGQTRFIASLLPNHGEGSSEPTDRRNWMSYTGGEWSARTSAAGRYLLFESKASIPGGEAGGLAQVYRYDAEAAGGAGALDCVSCNPRGENPIGPSSVARNNVNVTAQRWEIPRNLLPDGKVAFTSRDDLLVADTNETDDVYLWDEGELHLLSTGTSDLPSYFFGASANGSDLFFVTSEALVPQDRDDLADLYDARVGGGLAAQFAKPIPGCSGEECRGPGSQNPPGPAPLSSSLQGAGNVKEPRRCGKGKRRMKARNGKVRCVKKNRKRNRANRNRRAGR